MTFLKAAIYTFLFIFFIEISSLWILLFSLDTMAFVLPYHKLINAIFQLGIVIYFIIWIQKEKILIKKTSILFYVVAIILGVSFIYFQSILNAVYYFKIPKNSFQLNYDFENLKSLDVFVSFLIIPFLEELFFRGYIQKGLQKTKNIKFAIFLTSILFAFIHVPIIALFYDFLDFSFHHAYIAFFGSIISGILFYKSKSIGPSIIFHVFWNLTVYVTFYPNT